MIRGDLASCSIEQAIDQLTLIRSRNIGPATYQRLIKRFGSAKAALAAIPDLVLRGGSRTPKIAEKHQIIAELKQIERLNAKVLFIGDPLYPELLYHLPNAPSVLIYRGSLSHLKKPIVAIVGARNASAAACRFARELAGNLNSIDVTIVSGLARGIDTAAHQGSIQKSTIGVVAGGINVYYPPENEELQEQIGGQGLLLSEQPPGTHPKARHFPYRNRIIAGLAAGTVVVEAAPKSGSLITARLAAEAGRQVMAVPGSPIDPRSKGCNHLIREGASLVQNAEDVAELIQHFDDRADLDLPQHQSCSLNSGGFEDYDAKFDEASNKDREQISHLLSVTAVAEDELLRQSDVSPSALHLILLELELSGKIVRHVGGKISLKN